MAKLFIDGVWQAADGGETMPVFAPSTGQEIARIACAGASDVDRAVKAARRAVEGAWGRLTATERGRLMMRLAERILDHAQELTDLEARDTGKPMSQARADVQALARYFEYYGAAADKVHGDTIPYLNGYNIAIVKEPHGVTAHITPWNYPAQMFGRTLAPALAMGNATVIKPAEDACLSALRIVELAAEVGLPDGALNLVTGRGEEAGAALAAHPDINFISFTGSPEVGTLIQTAAARNHIGCTLELGGKSPQVVFADADMDLALPTVQKAIIQNAGQTCSAGSRLLVQRSVYDGFTERLAESFAKVRVGPHHIDPDCGPVINPAQRARVQGYIDRARADGIPVIAEAQYVPDLPAGGYYVLPTLFGPVPRGNALACEEVFGPVLSILPFEDEEDAVRLANATEYGLVAGVWTRDGAKAQRVARRIRSGQVFINCYGAGGGVELPFGGVKKSGHGREKGFMALEEFCVTKTVVNYHG
ncbi:aldehyde dehydrogenase family protein [Azospirillum sp.]|uniref:aldehyde dehydrogenase family protein n=1 Tax=Azospirillum sp. TaxID=34012 RepID=UPI002D27E1A0|nr:aldehyde dehydrogenase family protein [Azospirillum sp.]HYD67963.1 aldehyde dehydrogenase family protein [Azospirillum sp.]